MWQVLQCASVFSADSRWSNIFNSRTILWVYVKTDEAIFDIKFCAIDERSWSILTSLIWNIVLLVLIMFIWTCLLFLWLRFGSSFIHLIICMNLSHRYIKPDRFQVLKLRSLLQVPHFLIIVKFVLTISTAYFRHCRPVGLILALLFFVLIVFKLF